MIVQPFRAFTLSSKVGVLRILQTDCRASAAFDPVRLPADQHPTFEQFIAIWDTGASASVITQNVVTKCGLKPTGMVKVHHAHGTAVAETFLVNIMLPNDVGMAHVKVTCGTLTGADLLIGMDIITMGDLSITNVGGRTTFSFRVPSQKTVDFVEEHNRLLGIKSPAPTGGMTPKQFGMHKKRGK